MFSCLHFRMSRTKLITFDVTGTLLQFRSPVYKQYTEAAAKHGIYADPDVVKSNFKTEWARMTIEHPIYGKHTGLGWETWWTSMVKSSFKNYIKSPDDEFKISKVAECLIKSFTTPKAWAVAGGAHELLKFLKLSDIKLGVISNFDPRLHSILHAMEINEYFQFVVTSYEVGFEKPNPEIFEEALKRCSNTVASEAVHIGDNLNLDYFAAKKAGWDSILLLQSEPDKTENKIDPSQVFRNLTSLEGYFRCREQSNSRT